MYLGLAKKKKKTEGCRPNVHTHASRSGGRGCDAPPAVVKEVSLREDMFILRGQNRSYFRQAERKVVRGAQLRIVSSRNLV